jgi:hypothetical protein
MRLRTAVLSQVVEATVDSPVGRSPGRLPRPAISNGRSGGRYRRRWIKAFPFCNRVHLLSSQNDGVPSNDPRHVAARSLATHRRAIGVATITGNADGEEAIAAAADLLTKRRVHDVDAAARFDWTRRPNRGTRETTGSVRRSIEAVTEGLEGSAPGPRLDPPQGRQPTSSHPVFRGPPAIQQLESAADLLSWIGVPFPIVQSGNAEFIARQANPGTLHAMSLRFSSGANSVIRIPLPTADVASITDLSRYLGGYDHAPAFCDLWKAANIGAARVVDLTAVFGMTSSLFHRVRALLDACHLRGFEEELSVKIFLHNLSGVVPVHRHSRHD